jgi:hypothetical protein
MAAGSRARERSLASCQEPKVTRISKTERAVLDDCIWYLNLEEMRTFCQAHDLPRHIHVERPGGALRRTSDRDRKDIVLQRIRDFALRGERSAPTVYGAVVMAEGPLPARITARTRVHYGQYEKRNPRFVETLQRLTGGAFRLGMIARLVLRDFWTEGVAPTMQQFADAWLKATAEHTEPRPEGAYVSDLHKGLGRDGWKELRVGKAKRALAVLDKLVS